MKIKCICGAEHRVSTDYVGKKVKCNKCNHRFVVQRQKPQTTTQDKNSAEQLEYFPDEPQKGKPVCSDNECPCDEVRIPKGQGYLFISEEIVRFRRKYRTLKEARKHQEELTPEMTFGMGDQSFNFYRLGAILICEQAANLRKINKKVAHADAVHWWKTRQVPLRPTPLSSVDAPESQGTYSIRQSGPTEPIFEAEEQKPKKVNGIRDGAVDFSDSFGGALLAILAWSFLALAMLIGAMGIATSLKLSGDSTLGYVLIFSALGIPFAALPFYWGYAKNNPLLARCITTKLPSGGYLFEVERRLLGLRFTYKRSVISGNAELKVEQPNKFMAEIGSLLIKDRKSGSVLLTIWGAVPIPVLQDRARQIAMTLGVYFQDEEMEILSAPSVAEFDQKGTRVAIKSSGIGRVIVVQSSSGTEFIPVNLVDSVAAYPGDTLGEWLRNTMLYLLAIVFTVGFALFVIFFLGLRTDRRPPQITFFPKDMRETEPITIKLPYGSDDTFEQFVHFINKHTGLNVDQ